MLSARAVNIYGFIAIAIMLIMLVLVYAHAVPAGAGMVLFYAAAALFAVRIILRIALARQQKKEGGEEGS
jgi:Flp pilus assembly protein TadB